MGRKHAHPEHENLERWLVSYADFITLLFATFTALYAMSQMDISKMKDVSKAIQEGFQQQSILNAMSVFKEQSPPSNDTNPAAEQRGGGKGILDYPNMTFQPGEVQTVNKVVKQLQNDLSTVNRKIAKESSAAAASGGPELPPKGIDVSMQERGLKISIDSSLLFDSGSASLKQSALADLDTIADRLKTFNNSNIIHVEGNTDDLPIATAIFPSNWELSGARASAVVRFFINHHDYSPGSMVAVGYGSSRPIDTNLTAEGRRKNRRVDIVIYSDKVGNQTDPTFQRGTEQMEIDSSAPEPMDKQSQLIQEESEDTNGPVKVIYVKPDGTKQILNPTVVNPDAKPDLKPKIGK